MLLFAHAGITLGAAFGLEMAVNRLRRFRRGNPAKAHEGSSPASRIVRAVDYRLVLIGALLPDVVDKPLGHYLLSDSLNNNGRIFAHTFLFFLILLIVGLYRLWRGGHIGVMVLALASGGHLVLDEMWHTKVTLWWPFYGWSFPEYLEIDMWGWLGNLYAGLSGRPDTFIPEIIGAVILVSVVLLLIWKGGLVRFLKEGWLV